MASATITATTAEIFAAQLPAAEPTNAAARSLLQRVSESSAAAAPATLSAAAATHAAAQEDPWRDWLWGFLAVLFLSQFYFVWQLAAVFALFLLAFGAIAGALFSGYMLMKSCDWAVARLNALRQSALTVSPATHNTRKPA